MKSIICDIWFRKLIASFVFATDFARFLFIFLSSQCTGDIIIKEGTIGTKMYFIQEGVVDIVMANGEVS